MLLLLSCLHSQFGISMFTQMNDMERAKFFGLRSKSRSRLQALTDNAEFLRRSAALTPAEVEAGATRAYEKALANTAAMRASVQQDELPNWTSVLPAVKNQGGEHAGKQPA
jgi:hypothetical protein